MELTEYSVFDLSWTDKKAETKNTRLFRNIKNSIFLRTLSYSIDL